MAFSRCRLSGMQLTLCLITLAAVVHRSSSQGRDLKPLVLASPSLSPKGSSQFLVRVSVPWLAEETQNVGNLKHRSLSPAWRRRPFSPLTVT